MAHRWNVRADAAVPGMIFGLLIDAALWHRAFGKLNIQQQKM
jgi:hypothetical protein